jgi:hypothetical protein
MNATGPIWIMLVLGGCQADPAEVVSSSACATEPCHEDLPETRGLIAYTCGATILSVDGPGSPTRCCPDLCIDTDEYCVYPVTIIAPGPDDACDY